MHRRYLLVPFLLLALLAAACRPSTDTLRNALLDADRGFAREFQIRGLDAWLDAVGDSGVVLRPNSPISAGRAAARERLAALYADTGFTMGWEPVFAGVAKSGDLGYTVGLSQAGTRKPNGAPVITSGRYVTIWRRERDGTWRVALHASVPDAGPGR